MDIKNKVVVITGASSGIGKAIAKELAKHGVKVVLGARSTGTLERVVDEIKKDNGDAMCTKTDVTNKTDLNRLVDIAVQNYGKLDVIINNAGVCELGRIDDLDIDGWDKMIDVNLKGVLYGMAAAIPIFKQQRSGHIINIISTAGIKIAPMQGVYAATKNAVRTLTEAMRQESDGTIRITGISPGFVKTDLVHNMKNQEMKSIIQNKMEQFAISPQAIARAVLYVISQPGDVEVGEIVIRPSAQS